MRKAVLMAAISTTVLVAAIPAVAQMAEDSAGTLGNAAIEQYPAVTGLCEHVPGENVVATNPLPPYVFLQFLHFDEIGYIVDPAEQRNAEEAQRQQLFRSGWKYVNYNCAGEGLMAPGPAGGDNTVRGTDEGETLQGTGENDTIWAGAGGDIVFGGEGHDVIHVEGDTSYNYSDAVSCGPGYDTVYTDAGFDREWPGDGIFGDDCENWPPIQGEPPVPPGEMSQEPTIQS